MNDFTLIKEKINKLNQIDKKRFIFGASKHDYKSYPVSVLEIESFENRYGFQIPEQYRSFLLEIGYGAGPYYGILSLKETDSELSGEIKCYKEEENVIVHPANIFPFTGNDIEFLKNSFGKTFAQEDERNTYPIDGNITILHQGCQGLGILVTTGEFAGTVWDLYCDGGYRGYWQPANPAPCLITSNKEKNIEKLEHKNFPVISLDKFSYEPLPFMDWYNDWLDNSLLAFTELNWLNSLRLSNPLSPI